MRFFATSWRFGLAGVARGLVGCLGMLAVIVLAPAPATAQRGAGPPAAGGPPPRTADGQRGPVRSVEQARWCRTAAAMVQPLPFTPEGLKAYNDVWNHIDPTSHCKFPGVPRVNTSPYPFQIVQLPDKVIFLYEYMHNFRVIYTDGRPHRKNWEPSLMGDSIGKWDGDTLVIDTVGPHRSHVAGRPRQPPQRRAACDRALAAHQRHGAFATRRPSTIRSSTRSRGPKGGRIRWHRRTGSSCEYACTDNNKDSDDGHLQPGPLDGSLRNGTAMPLPPPTPRGGGPGPGGGANLPPGR